MSPPGSNPDTPQTWPARGKFSQDRKFMNVAYCVDFNAGLS